LIDFRSAVRRLVGKGQPCAGKRVSILPTPLAVPMHVEGPMRFDFVVNMRTARELGITFPHEVALQITEVIE
jgi:hypothetical protein